MKFSDTFKLSTRMFRARTSQTMLTICGMGVGIAAILFLFRLGYGLQETLLARITTSESLLTLDVSEAKAGLVNLDSETIAKIRNMEGVEEVSTAFQLTAQGNLESLSADVITIGTDPLFLRLGGFRAINGGLLDNEQKEKVVITTAVAQLFGKGTEEMIEKEISFAFFIPKKETDEEGGLQGNFERVDYDKKYVIGGVIEGEENIIYIHSDTLKELGISRFSQAKVKCKSNSIMGSIRDQILEHGLLVSSLSDTVDQANKIFSVVQIVLTLFGIIALVVSAIGMFNTMTIALLERTEEIGIMKSIGASGMTIAAIFFMEAAIMGVLGGLGGVLMGLAGGEIFNALINFLASKFGGEPVDLFSSPTWFIPSIIIFSALVGIVTGFIPARRASKVDPLEALRYK